MRLLTFTALSSITFAHAKLASFDVRKLKPSDAGAYHTDGFEQLAKKYAAEKPKSRLDVIVDVSEIAASFCAPGDEMCRSNAYKATVEQFHSAGPEGVKYPKDFDIRVKESLDEVFKAVRDADSHDIDSLVNKITEIGERIEDLEDVNEVQQVAGLASVSVAVESAKLWHGVYHDETHPLHDMLGDLSGKRSEKKRRLQNDVVGADIEAAINAAINAINNDITILAIWPNIILAIIPNAYAASVNAAFSEDGDGAYFNGPPVGGYGWGYFGGYEGYDDDDDY